MEHIACLYCKFDAVYSPIEQMERMNINVYWCKNCHVEYLKSVDCEAFSGVSLYTVINQKLYRWTISCGRATLWYVKEQGIPGIQANRGCIMLLSISPDQLQPIITPENINQKIKAYLLFL